MKRKGGSGLARGWAISGISDPIREAVMAAADTAGLPVGAWVEQALHEALEATSAPAPPEGMGTDKLEAMVRRVVAEELRPLSEALLARPEATAASPSPAEGLPVSAV